MAERSEARRRCAWAVRGQNVVHMHDTATYGAAGPGVQDPAKAGGFAARADPEHSLPGRPKADTDQTLAWAAPRKTSGGGPVISLQPDQTPTRLTPEPGFV